MPDAMTNAQIADIFAEIADLMEILGEDRFRVNSYRKAARVVGEHSAAMADLAAEGRLEEVAGIGKSTAAKIAQAVAEGKVDLHAELKAKLPPGLPDLLAVGGLGPKTVAKLWRQAEVTSVDDLRKAVAEAPDRLAAVEGLGKKKVAGIADALAFLDAAGGRIRLDAAAAVVAELSDAVGELEGVARVEPAGSFRRGRETVGDIDLLCEAAAESGDAITTAFAEAATVAKVVARGATKCSIRTADGVEVDLRVVGRESFGAAMQYFTGSKAHNVRLRELAARRGLKLNEYGLFDGEDRVAGADEAGVYEALGLTFVPPELREDRGEVEAAVAGGLPEPVALADIRGDMHMHTTASDGANTIDEMIAACRKRGYLYMVISDHSKSQIQAHGLDERRLAEHAKAIREAGERQDGIEVLAGIEVDVMKDGRLDFDDEVLAELDFVTASAHSALSLGTAEATRRIIAAIESPHVHSIGHASGRLINQRPGMEIDIEAVAAAAADNDVALEINAHPWRLDLRDTHVRAAVEAGAKLVINSDAHEAGGLEAMRWGVVTARRGWATAADIINTWPWTKLKRWLTKGGRHGR